MMPANSVVQAGIQVLGCVLTTIVDAVQRRLALCFTQQVVVASQSTFFAPELIGSLAIECVIELASLRQQVSLGRVVSIDDD